MNPINFIQRFLGAVLFLASVTALPAQDWEHFRTVYPYHIQTVALSAENAKGHRTLVVSEPPPSVTLADIETLDPALRSAKIRTHGIGVDGWVRDVVIDLPPLQGEELQEILDRLQQRLFGTSYKAYVTPITSAPAPSVAAKLNLQVTSGDLRAWVLGKPRETSWGSMIGGMLLGIVLLVAGLALLATKRIILGLLLAAAGLYGLFSTSLWLTMAAVGLVLACIALQRIRSSETGQAFGCGFAAFVLLLAGGLGLHSQVQDPATLFSSLFGDEHLSCASILEQHKNGVFLSSQPGLVLWSFSKTSPIDPLQTEIREFALDSDLILGAVSSGDQVVVLARERATPIAQLPPLRTETILQLAAAREDELAQSYERNNPLAGRYDDANRLDWAPIYLSPRLIDTEYGSLLNITDQLLKGWTMRDSVVYVNFTYPKPSSYPFAGDLMSQLGTNELTFNWNTKGAGYVTRSGPYELIAFNRTGSLPIDYLAKGRPDVQDAEDVAYKYYSGLNDPNLVRVVQYAALYQIFHHFGVTAHIGDDPQPPVSPLLGAIDFVLGSISNITETQLARWIADGHTDFAQQARTVRDDLNSLSREDQDHTLHRALVAALASQDGRKEILQIQNIDQRNRLLDLIPGVEHVGSELMPPEILNMVRLKYAIKAGARDSRWIHTPSIVESQQVATSKDADRMVGGHNLSAAVTTFEQDATVDAGSVLVDESSGSRVVHYNPADDSKIGATVRDAARDETRTQDQVKAAVEKTLQAENRPPVALGEGLGFDERLHPDPLRGFEPAHAPGSVRDLGFRRTGGSVSTSDASLLKKLGGRDGRAVLIARDDSGRYIISAPPAEPLQASDMASSVDAYLALTRDAREGEVSLHLRGFDDRQAEGFMHNLEPHSDLHPTVVSTEHTVSAEELTAIFERRYDVAQAKILDEPHVLYEDGITQIEQQIAIPAREAGVKGLVLRIRVTLRDMLHVTRETLAEFAESLRGILTGLNPNDSLDVVTRQLVRELRGNQKFHQVRLKVEQQGQTIFWVHKENFDVHIDHPSDRPEEGGPAA